MNVARIIWKINIHRGWNLHDNSNETSSELSPKSPKSLDIYNLYFVFRLTILR